MFKYGLLICIFILTSCNSNFKCPENGKSSYVRGVSREPWPPRFSEIKSCVEAGADVNERGGKEKLTPLLLTARAPGFSSRDFSNKDRKDTSDLEGEKIIRYLVSKGARLNETSEQPNYQNALHLAAIAGRPHTIRTLVDLGIDINSLDSNKANALMHASASGCFDAVQAVVELGSAVNEVGPSNTTALDAAYQFSTREAYGMGMVICKEHDKIKEYLVLKGAKRAEELE